MSENSVVNDRTDGTREKPKMELILKGFSQVMGFRVFSFEGIDSDKVRTTFTVRADLSLTRKYGIRLQELPLLCRSVVERRPDGEDRRAFTYTEADMGVYADSAAAVEAAEQEKKALRRAAAESKRLLSEADHS